MPASRAPSASARAFAQSMPIRRRSRSVGSGRPKRLTPQKSPRPTIPKRRSMTIRPIRSLRPASVPGSPAREHRSHSPTRAINVVGGLPHRRGASTSAAVSDVGCDSQIVIPPRRVILGESVHQSKRSFIQEKAIASNGLKDNLAFPVNIGDSLKFVRQHAPAGGITPAI